MTHVLLLPYIEYFGRCRISYLLFILLSSVVVLTHMQKNSYNHHYMGTMIIKNMIIGLRMDIYGLRLWIEYIKS